MSDNSNSHTCDARYYSASHPYSHYLRPGPVGKQGPTGEQGINGRDGRDGKDGEQGEQGPRGYIGDKGEKGPTGQDGSPGLRGETGPTGEFGGVVRQHLIPDIDGKVSGGYSLGDKDHWYSDIWAKEGHFSEGSISIGELKITSKVVEGKTSLVLPQNILLENSGQIGLQGPPGEPGKN